MRKAKTRKESVKRLIDASGNVQAVISKVFTDYTEKRVGNDGKAEVKRFLDVGVLVRHSYESAMSKSACETDLVQNCKAVRNERAEIDGKEVYFCNHKDFLRYATEDEKKTLRESAKFPFRFFAASVLPEGFPLYQFIESMDECAGIYAYELHVMQEIAKEKEWSVI